MNRQRSILSATILLVVSFVFYWVWSGWGLITVETNDMRDKSLAAVMRSIEKQAGIVMRSNMDPAKPVAMHVHKVPLTEALETLREVTDSRWRLGYFFAADSATVSGALDSIASGKRPEGWKNFEVPLFVRPGSFDDGALPIDPRYDTWNVNDPAEKTLQGFMQAAAAGVSASFTCPEAFNPAVGKSPSSGAIRKAAPQLAKIAGAKVQEVFLLMGRPAGVVESDRNRDEDDGPMGGGPGRSRGGFTRGGGPPNFDLMRQRQLAEIAKLPASERKTAQAEFDDREKFFKELRELPDDQRRAKMEEYANNPANQDKMADRQQKGNERKTPEQRLQKYQSYVAKKQAVMNSRGQ